MTTEVIESGLKTLGNIIEELKGLLAWEDLKRSEAGPADFLPATFENINQDIKNQYSRFLRAKAELHPMLNSLANSRLPSIRKETLRQDLRKMEEQFQGLNLTERFLRP